MRLVKVGDANVQGFSAQARQGRWVVCHYMNGCMHCEMMKPAWEQAKKAVKDVPNLQVAEVEYAFTQQLPGKMANVMGFPSIVAYQNGLPYREFDAMRTVENLTRFLRDNVDSAAPARPKRAASARPAADKRKPRKKRAQQ